MPNTKAAWAAGFFDGEGNIGCWLCHKENGREYYKITMQVNQVGTDCLERFNLATGNLGKLYSVPARRNSKQQYRWAISKQSDVKTAVAILWPYLSPVKKNQIQRAFEKYDAVRVSN